MRDRSRLLAPLLPAREPPAAVGCVFPCAERRLRSSPFCPLLAGGPKISKFKSRSLGKSEMGFSHRSSEDYREVLKGLFGESVCFCWRHTVRVEFPLGANLSGVAGLKSRIFSAVEEGSCRIMKGDSVTTVPL